MNTQDNFPEVVSGRITTRAKKLMDKYGLTVRFCVEHCIDMYVSKQNQRLLEKDQLKGVYIVTTDNKALLRWVRLGKQWGDQVEVLSGLNPQDKVVTSSQGRLYNSCLIAE